MKLLVSLKTLELESYLKFTNSFLIGLKDYCVNYHEASTNEIKNLLEKYPQIELFISINKNIFNEDITLELISQLSFLATEITSSKEAPTIKIISYPSYFLRSNSLFFKNNSNSSLLKGFE